jgi:ABC-type Zn uptake system ZnuABC Zn-binding protein ZnuA
VGKLVNWPTVKYISECQQEILKQLDIKSLIKRIIFIEYCLTYVFEEYELEGLQLKKPTSPQ